MQISLSPPLKVVFTMPETKRENVIYNHTVPKRHNSKIKHPNHLNNSIFKLVVKITYPQIIGFIRLIDPKCKPSFMSPNLSTI